MWSLPQSCTPRSWTYQMERQSRERAGSSSKPARRTRTCEYHISRQIITADPTESLKKLQRPWNDLELSPVHVCLNLSLHVIYKVWATTITHHETVRTQAIPIRPMPITLTANHVSKIWRRRAAPEMYALGITTLWAWRNFWAVKLTA